MESYFLNLSPSNHNGSALSKLYLFMAVVFFILGGLGVYRHYTAEEEVALGVYFLPLLQVALAFSYLVVAWRRRKATGTSYVQVTEEHLELKLSLTQAAITLPWDTISLLRVQSDKLLYRLTSGQTGQIELDSVPEEYEEAVRDAIRQAGKRKGVSL
ncbi:MULTISPECIES: hypothetical protein [Rufibacter]|uniref:hypothetical protein n=1 Tax=Rufibacter TaxID=1379908 RepID=UPI001B3127BC|nr:MULTISPECIES: hypothetical protein [Rufibacter]